VLQISPCSRAEYAAFCQVAAQGSNFQIYSDGSVFGIDGTSASSPTFASVIAIINDRLGALGRPSLGFLNRASSLYRIRARACNS
jgi:hypothetical protein